MRVGESRFETRSVILVVMLTLVLAGLACNRARGHEAAVDAAPGESQQRIDPTKPLCPQLEDAAEAALDSLFAKSGTDNREWVFDLLPRVDCWAADNKHTSALPSSWVWSWVYENSPRRARGVAVLGLLVVGNVSPAVPFNLPDLVRAWRDELIRRGFSPRSQEWDLKQVVVFTDGRGYYEAEEHCTLYSHGSDQVDFTPLKWKPDSIGQLPRAAIRRAGENCFEPTPKEREERRKAAEDYQKSIDEMCSRPKAKLSEVNRITCELEAKR